MGPDTLTHLTARVPARSLGDAFPREVTTHAGARRTTLTAALFLALAASRSSAQGEAERWVFSATARETLTDNLFLIPADGPGESITGATLGLSWTRKDDASLLSGLGWANGNLFRQFGAYNGVQWGAGLYGQKDFTRRAQGRASLSYADGLNLERLYAGRVGLPQLDVKTGVATAGFSYKFTPATVASASLDATGTRYRADTLLSSARLPADAQTPTDVRNPLNPTPSDVPEPPDATLDALALLSSQSIHVYRLDYWTWRAGGRLDHDFSPRTSVDLGVGYRRTGQDPDTFSFGDQLEATAGLRRIVGSDTTLSFTYAYQDNRFDPPTRTHSFFAAFAKKFSTKVTGDVSLGSSYLDTESSLASGWTPVGGVGVSVRLKRTFFAARYTRSRYQALVLGRNQTVDLFYASLGQSLSKRVYLSLYGYYNDAQDPVSDLYSYETGLAGAALGARLGKRGSAGVSYDFRHFKASGLTGAGRSSVSFFVGYARAFK
jgi:hypothetical protein